MSKPVDETVVERRPLPRLYAHYHRLLIALLEALVNDARVVWLTGEEGHSRRPDGQSNTYRKALYVLEDLSNVDLLDGADISANYVYGLSTTPTASVAFLPTEQEGDVIVQPNLRYDRYQLLGIDFSLAALGGVFRGEAAYTLTPNCNETDADEAGSRLDAVLGAEATLTDVTLIAQGLMNFRTATELLPQSLDFSSTLSALYDLDNRTSLDGTWLQNYSDGSGFAAGKLEYAFTNGVKGAFQVTAYYGNEGSVWSAFQNLSDLRLGLAYAF